MSYSIAYQQRAINEYEEATIWYRERSEQAAENFEVSVKQKIGILRDNPIQYKKTYKEFQEVRLRKYPFNIIYLIDDTKMLIIISSIYHDKRNPNKKYRKLK